MKRGHASRGFTLIELLVVIAIIGLLASIILASLSTARAKGRDAKRIADIRDIQNALELYDETCHNYPNTLSLTASNGCPTGVTLGSFIASIPTDPGSGQGYLYAAQGPSHTSTVCTSYHIGADLELGQTLGSQTLPNSNYCSGGNYVAPARGNGVTPVPPTNGDFQWGCQDSTTCSTANLWVYDQYGS